MCPMYVYLCVKIIIIVALWVSQKTVNVLSSSTTISFSHNTLSYDLNVRYVMAVFLI